MRDAELGQAACGGQDVVEIQQRLAHAHEDRVIDRLDPAEVERLVEGVRLENGTVSAISRGTAAGTFVIAS